MPTFDKMSPNSIKEAVRYDLGVLRQRAIDFLSDWIVIDGIIEKFPVQVKFVDESWQVIARGSDSRMEFSSKKEALNEAKRLANEFFAPLEVYGKSGLLERRQNSVLDIEQSQSRQ